MNSHFLEFSLIKSKRLKLIAVITSLALVALPGCTNQNSENAFSIEYEEPATDLVDLPEVQIDSNGNRFFPAETLQERDDYMWNEVLTVFEAQGVEPPPRPVISERKETNWDTFPQEFVDCMHEAGYTSVYIDTESPGAGEVVIEGAPGQLLSSSVAEFTCRATVQPPPESPPNEVQMRALYRHQIESVIPCLDKLGYTLESFPTEEAFVDGWFANRTYSTAIRAYGEPVTSMALDPDFACAEFPPNF